MTNNLKFYQQELHKTFQFYIAMSSHFWTTKLGTVIYGHSRSSYKCDHLSFTLCGTNFKNQIEMKDIKSSALFIPQGMKRVEGTQKVFTLVILVDPRIVQLVPVLISLLISALNFSVTPTLHFPLFFI